MIFSRHNFYSLRLDKKTANRQDFLRENIAPEHFAMTTQIDFDNQLPRCLARVLLKGESSIDPIERLHSFPGTNSTKAMHGGHVGVTDKRV